MGLRSVWKNYNVLIVMGTGLGLIHWGWYKLQLNPIIHPEKEDQEISIFRFLSHKLMDSKDK
ncbi:uncharacterized homolog [Eleutherodactylus coqui]|uniref:uncharacterized homolog n=1 Tax=Eleutherodactylus coqui TaxID=57060 RepID=UPI0034625212